MSKKYKITPLGYLLLLIIILSVLFFAARSIQSSSPITSLIYKLNHTETEYTSGHLELTSEGDAINLAIKDMAFNFETSKEYIHLEGLLKKNQILLPAFDSFFNRDNFLFKTSLQNEYTEMSYDDLYLLTDFHFSYQIEEFLDATHDNASIYTLIQKYPLVFSKVLKPYAYLNNEQIIISITFEDLFVIIDELIAELYNEDYFRQLLLSYISDYYTIYDDINNSDSSQELDIWQNDIKTTLQNKIYSFKSVLLKEYNNLSKIELVFEGAKSIEAMSIKGKFYYNHCDAYEDLFITIERSESITSYPEEINLNVKSNLTLFKTFLKFYQ